MNTRNWKKGIVGMDIWNTILQSHRYYNFQMLLYRYRGEMSQAEIKMRKNILQNQ